MELGLKPQEMPRNLDFLKPEHVRINFSHISTMFRAILLLALVQVHSEQEGVKQVAKETVEH